MDFLTEFGVKPILLLAQIVNFLILLFILKRFLYKPILKVLEERKQKIAQSVKNADEIELRLNKIEEDRDKAIEKAALEAKKILEEAAKNAETIIAAAHQKAALDIEKLMEKSKQAMEQEKDKLYLQIREELADIVVLSLEKVAGQVVSEKQKKTLIEKSIKGLV